MKKMLGLVLAAVMVLSLGGFALGYDYYSGEVTAGAKQGVMFTVYTQVELPCFLEVTLEGNVVGLSPYPAKTVTSIGQGTETFDTWSNYSSSWYMTFWESQTSMIPPGTTPPSESKWLYDCGQAEPPIWHLLVKATDTWKFYLLGGDLGNQDTEKIRIQRKISGAVSLSYADMAGGGEANQSEASLRSLGPNNTSYFATMHAQGIYTGTNTAGTDFYFKYRIPHKWTTPQGYYEGVIGYLVLAYE